MAGSTSGSTKWRAPEGVYRMAAEREGNMPFSSSRCTMLTLAPLGAEEGEDLQGMWVLYSCGDAHLHICKLRAMCAYKPALHKDPVRSLVLGPKPMGPTCHDFDLQCKDGVDTLVGCSDGQVLLLSLRAQLQPSTSSKPTIAATVPAPEGAEGVKCCAVLWLPGTLGHFLIAYPGGTIYIYKKVSVLHEGNSKLALALGANSKAPIPAVIISVSGGGLHDVAISPNGAYLAAACRDGAVRVIATANGQLMGGWHSYYGAMLCCAFSSDSRYVAAGGEDDLVSVYSMAERAPVAHCQGHNSYVSRVRFDPYLQLGLGVAQTGLAAQGTPSPGSEAQDIYRVASVGQDARLCIWDVQMLPGESELVATPAAERGGMRKSASVKNLEMARKSSGDLLALVQLQQAQPLAPSHQRKPSASASKANSKAGIVPALPFRDMNVVHPITGPHRLHHEPISDLRFTEKRVISADYTGTIRVWQRPGPDELLRRSMKEPA